MAEIFNEAPIIAENGRQIKSPNELKSLFISPNLFNELAVQLEKNLSDKKEVLKINRIIENAIHWALVNGFVFIPKGRLETDLMVVTHMPFTLYPSPFKRAHFENVVKLQPQINELVYRIATTPSTLEKAFENSINADKFLNSLWHIYKCSLRNGYNQKIHFSVLRVDYMLNQQKSNSNMSKIKQVEINTISVGLAFISTRMSELHRRVLNWSGYNNLFDKLPLNVPVERVANGFVQTWKLYGNKNAIVLFVVVDVEINIADQRHLEYEIIKQEPNIEVIRATLEQINENSLLNEDKVLMYNDREVAIVYFRAGYDPSHYKSQNEWDALLKVEMSKSVKCPNVGTFLAGMKKIQEFISRKEVLVELCNNDLEEVEALKEVFAKFLKLDNNENFEEVLANSDEYVLKPQREGGGNNFYNEDVKNILSKIKEMERTGAQIEDTSGIYDKNLYVAMELFKPLVTENFIVSSRTQQQLNQSLVESGKAVPAAIKNEEFLLKKTLITYELGIYAVLVKDGEKSAVNESCGYCLRTKPASENEAGVLQGSGALDSIYFVD